MLARLLVVFCIAGTVLFIVLSLDWTVVEAWGVEVLVGTPVPVPDACVTGAAVHGEPACPAGIFALALKEAFACAVGFGEAVVVAVFPDVVGIKN